MMNIFRSAADALTAPRQMTATRLNRAVRINPPKTAQTTYWARR
jgi:hypothetical protein